MSIFQVPPDRRLEERIRRLESLTTELSRSHLRLSRLVARMAGVPEADLAAEEERMRSELRALGIDTPEV